MITGFFLTLQPATAQSDNFNIEIGGFVKELGQISFDNALETFHYDNIVSHRLETEWAFSSQWELKADLRTRILNGFSVENQPGLADFYEQDPNYLDLSWIWLDTDHTLIHSNIDRLNLSYINGPWEVNLGRQRVNWSRTFVWSPNDLFNNFAYLNFDYEKRPGVDAITAQYNWSYASSVETAIRFADNFNEMVIAAMIRTSWNTYGIQFLAGHYLDQLALGTGWAGYIGGAGFRGEISYFHPEDNFFESTGHFTATTGVDYMFSNSLYLQTELLYNGGYKAQTDPLIELLKPPTADNLFTARTGFFINGSYPLHPLINTSLGFLGSFDRSLFIIIPQVTVSLSQNIDFLMLGQFLKGTVLNEAVETSNLLYFRLKWSY
jgi:hypothetical protein